MGRASGDALTFYTCPTPVSPTQTLAKLRKLKPSPLVMNKLVNDRNMM
jgi:hypothetical protein